MLAYFPVPKYRPGGRFLSVWDTYINKYWEPWGGTDNISFQLTDLKNEKYYAQETKPKCHLICTWT